jgi:hypothetical protein
MNNELPELDLELELMMRRKLYGFGNSCGS